MIIRAVAGIERGMKRLALALTTLALSTGCWNYVDGGPEASETRSLEGFDSLRVDDGLKVTLSKGAPSVTIDAPQRVLEVLETKVEKGRLTVGLRPAVRVTTADTIVISVSGEGVTVAEANGGSRIDAAELSGSPLRLTASGGSTVVAGGSSEDLRLSASGGSTVDVTKLTTTEASVDASGGSTVLVHATGNVVGTASGGSQVTVTGGGDTSKLSVSGGSTVQ